MFELKKISPSNHFCLNVRNPINNCDTTIKASLKSPTYVTKKETKFISKVLETMLTVFGFDDLLIRTVKEFKKFLRRDINSEFIASPKFNQLDSNKIWTNITTNKCQRTLVKNLLGVIIVAENISSILQSSGVLSTIPGVTGVILNGTASGINVVFQITKYIRYSLAINHGFIVLYKGYSKPAGKKFNVQIFTGVKASFKLISLGRKIIGLVEQSFQAMGNEPFQLISYETSNYLRLLTLITGGMSCWKRHYFDPQKKEWKAQKKELKALQNLESGEEKPLMEKITTQEAITKQLNSPKENNRSIRFITGFINITTLLLHLLVITILLGTRETN